MRQMDPVPGHRAPALRHGPGRWWRRYEGQKQRGRLGQALPTLWPSGELDEGLGRHPAAISHHVAPTAADGEAMIMKQLNVQLSRDRRGRSAWSSAVLVLALLLMSCVAQRERVDYLEILSRVNIGDAREEAIEAFSDAWYHSECVFLSGRVEDMFFYGPRELDQVTIIAVGSWPEDSGLVVKASGTLDPEFLYGFATLCDPPLLDPFQ